MLSTSDFEKLVQFLENSAVWQLPIDRLQFMTEALQGSKRQSEIQPKLNLGNNPHVCAVDVVSTLQKYDVEFVDFIGKLRRTTGDNKDAEFLKHLPERISRIGREATFHDVPTGYLEWVTRRYSRPDIDDVFVSLQVEKRIAAGSKHISSSEWFATTDVKNQATSLDELSDEGILPRQVSLITRSVHPNPGTLDVATAIRDSRHIVLLGDPGIGKTTLCQFVASLFAQTILKGSKRAIDRHGNDYGDTSLPVIVELGRAGSRIQNEGLEKGLKQVILTPSPELPEALRQATVGALEAAYESGRLCIILDGLDEILNSLELVKV